ncbi:MAG: hydroxymethylbilane synthase [Acidimicrobiales bacterium]|nr:hydroxymethylbilane synthase [Acidimicrobiales bacterium]MDP6894123.1 hydroxymethylbilane synthase [Acidimicrobiales bacterium]
MTLRIATRGSRLALRQTQRVAELLSEASPAIEIETVVVSTVGDRDKKTSLQELGGQGVFVTDVQSAVLSGEADIAVHSAKDLPAKTSPGLTLASVPERADPRDALVGSFWVDLPKGATIATGSIRRRSHLSHLRPDLKFQDLRGNIETRLLRIDEVDAVVIAKAALDRLDLNPEQMDPLPVSVLLPQVGQGALGIECREEDLEIIQMLKRIEDQKVRAAVDAERSFLAEVGSGCSLPVAAHAVLKEEEIFLEASIASKDGMTLLKAEGSGSDANKLGLKIANKLLNEEGGSHLLNENL